ncbi:MAG: SprB repeat-containing protein, partial [Bacteroidota bacterium]
MKNTHPPVVVVAQPSGQVANKIDFSSQRPFRKFQTFGKVALSFLAMFGLFFMPEFAFAQLTVDFTVTPPTCAGYTNGSAEALPQGGTAPYQFHWSNNQGGQAIYGLTGGTFSLTVTDATGSTVVGNVTVTPPDPVVAKINPDMGVCAGNTGTYTAIGDGGTASYNYMWSNGATSQTISTQDTGYFFVTITDVNGCFDVGGFQIFDKLSVDVVTKNSSCAGICDGSATAFIHGGVKPYTYFWNTGSNAAAIFPLPPGIYTVSVTDSLGCMATGTGIVLEPPPIFLDLQVDGECTGNGNASVIASGGSPPFQYLWSTGSTDTSVSNLSEGYYFVTITDSLSCQVDTQVVISNGAVLAIAEKDDATCLGLDDGSALAAAPSGIGPLNFTWSDGQTPIAANNLAPGNYGLTLTDAAGCEDTASVVIGADIVITVDGSGTEAGCNDAQLGTATASVILGGNPPYSFLWNDSLAQTSLTAIGLDDGTYT